ncbi:tetratricopeptide repeat protein [Crocosphaera sp. UHCC 0190]|uniref:tetratricopeptide repeat protein n=1 Tax=Crocosphaera sp. UHCC 0190 TaxID=3110246 RepID=UPI002B21151C|nr:tetratricopeptide repeat protein [Crocosphaera sp. UHCC 0190]MEA5512175.1 tetratricopeptide repeat protein [Crocosphaera sp. UHCC 0190]
MLESSLLGILFASSNLASITHQEFNQDQTIKVNLSPGNNEISKKSRLSQSLEMIDQMDDSHLKIILLNNLALSYANLGKLEQAIALLKNSLSIAENFEDITLKITTLNNIASHYDKIGQKKQAINILNNTISLINTLEDQSVKGKLLLTISFEYEKIGQGKKAEILFAKSQTIITEASQPLPEFPFTETPSSLKLGFAGAVNSFRDTTGFLGVNLNFSKQWSEKDILVDGNISFNYDSSRTVNNYRPGSFITSVYRHHFDSDWNFFVNFFNTVNEDLFSSRNDDEDLTIISNIWLGSGLNLWRGESNREFLDFQMGLGPRYEYDYINFEKRRDEINPTLAIILLGRGFSFEQANINQTLAIIPDLGDWDNYIISSNTELSFPLTERWSFTNRLFLRYRNQQIYEENPKLHFFFSTGLEYKF